jgi:hypothetical protein
MAAAAFLTLMLAQGPPAEASDPAQMERIRRALAETQAITATVPTGADGSVFRVTVRGRKPDKPLWADLWSVTPSNVRPWFRSYHHEYLERVTAEQFRSATLYPVGTVTTEMIESLVKGIKALHRNMSEADARREVQQALEELHACRANPARPGCHLPD